MAGLFDAFKGGASIPGIYAPWMTYDPNSPTQPPTSAPGANDAAMAAPRGGLFSRFDPASAAAPPAALPPAQPPTGAAAEMPTRPHMGVLGTILDTLLAGGMVGSIQNRDYRNKVADYKSQQFNDVVRQMMGGGGADPQPSSQPSAGAGAGMAPGAMPTMPGAHASPLTPQMRKGLATMAMFGGHPEQAATILDDRKKIAAGPDGWMYDQDTGEVIGRLPQHTNQNGFNVDLGAANAPSFIPKLPDGTVPDGQGGAVNIPRLPEAMGAQSEAQAAGTARGQAPYQIHALPGAGPGGGTLYGTTAGLVGPGGPLGGRTIGGQGPGDTAYATDTAKNAVGQYQGIQTAGQQALTAIPKYQRLGELLDGYSGNKLSPVGVDLAQFARGIPGMANFDPKLPNKEAAMAITNQLALSLRDPSQGGGMPGSLSNSDRDFLVKSVPNLAQTDQGRKIMVESAVKLNQRNADLAAKARAWQQRFGRIDAADATGKTFFDYAQAYAESHPLFGAQQ